MSVDPHSPSPEQTSSEGSPSLPEENLADPIELRKVKRRYRKNDLETGDGATSDSEILVLSSLLRNLIERKQTVPEDVDSKAKVNRFVPKSSAPASLGPDVGGGSAAGLDAPPSAAAPALKLKPRTAQGSTGKNHWQPKSPWGGRLAYLVLGLAIAAVAYMAGRQSVPPESPSRLSRGGQVPSRVPKLTPVWTPGMISQLDAALAADQDGELQTADQLAASLKKQKMDLPGLELYLSTLQVRAGNYDDAEVEVSKLIDAFTPPAQAAAVNEHLGFVYSRHRDFPRAVSSFADAAAADPFNADHFVHWAEALRREGQLGDAINRFKQALTRLPVGLPSTVSQRAEIEFKVRLTQIEANTDGEVKSALDTHLKQADPSGYWLLTAAAYDLQHNDLTAAISALEKARAVLSADDYAVLTGDYFFHTFAERPEFTTLPTGNPLAVREKAFVPRMGYFIDP